eukprot:scaffold130517_cov58-Attheya_sp.AAC.5
MVSTSSSASSSRRFGASAQRTRVNAVSVGLSSRHFGAIGSRYRRMEQRMQGRLRVLHRNVKLSLDKMRRNFILGDWKQKLVSFDGKYRISESVVTVTCTSAITSLASGALVTGGIGLVAATLSTAVAEKLRHQRTQQPPQEASVPASTGTSAPPSTRPHHNRPRPPIQPYGFQFNSSNRRPCQKKAE